MERNETLDNLGSEMIITQNNIDELSQVASAMEVTD